MFSVVHRRMLTAENMAYDKKESKRENIKGEREREREREREIARNYQGCA